MFDYDGNKDWWNSYNQEEHMKTIEEYTKVDFGKWTLKALKLKEELRSGKLMEQANSPKHQCGQEEPNSQMEEDHNSEEEDENKYADDMDMPVQNFIYKRHITVQNLRIWEE